MNYISIEPLHHTLNLFWRKIAVYPMKCNEEDHMLQLAGHLCGRSLKEWELLDESSKESLAAVIDALMLDPDTREDGIEVDSALLSATDGVAYVLVSNPTALYCCLKGGDVLGAALPVQVIEDSQEQPEADGVVLVNRIGPPPLDPLDSEKRKKKLVEALEEMEQLDPAQKQQLMGLLQEHHAAFCLDESERDETDLIKMEISTGEAEPKKQPAKRMPHVVRQEAMRWSTSII